jgi:hypothetical protein
MELGELGSRVTERGATPSDRSRLRLGGGLIVGGLLFNGLVTMAWHPSGSEDDHPAIFSEYAASDGWVATHFGQFVGVGVAIAGLIVLCRALMVSGVGNVLPRLAIGALIATGAAFAILQGLDGIALKQAVDAWAGSSGPEEEIRFANAETVRWTEWGFQGYFRILLGVSLGLIGLAVLVKPLVAQLLGWLAIVAGAMSIVTGVDVAYSGLEGGPQDALSPVFQLAVIVFALGVLATGLRRRDPRPA